VTRARNLDIQEPLSGHVLWDCQAPVYASAQSANAGRAHYPIVGLRSLAQVSCVRKSILLFCQFHLTKETLVMLHNCVNRTPRVGRLQRNVGALFFVSTEDLTSDHPIRSWR
jgi:hypothetical protein